MILRADAPAQGPILKREDGPFVMPGGPRRAATDHHPDLAVTWSRTKPRSETHGSAHDKARKSYAAAHHPTNPCVRCGHALGPMGPWLHLDHHDQDKTRYLGFSHGSRPCPICGKRCNLRAAALLGNAKQKARRQTRNRQSTSKITRLRW